MRCRRLEPTKSLEAYLAKLILTSGLVMLAFSMLRRHLSLFQMDRSRWVAKWSARLSSSKWAAQMERPTGLLYSFPHSKFPTKLIAPFRFTFPLPPLFNCGPKRPLTSPTYRTNFTARPIHKVYLNPSHDEVITVSLIYSSGLYKLSSPFGPLRGRLISPVSLSPAPLPPPSGTSTSNCL